MTIQIVNCFNNKKIRPNGLVLNSKKNELFITDVENHQILITDFQIKNFNDSFIVYLNENLLFLITNRKKCLKFPGENLILDSH